MTAVHGPWWTREVQLVVELGIAGETNVGPVALWDQVHWDKAASGGWSGIEPDWWVLDTCDLYDVTITRGRDRWIDRYGASTASITADDAEGRLSWSQRL